MPGTTADWIKILSYICIKWLSTFQCSGWLYGCILTSSKAMEVGWSCQNWVTAEYKPYHYDMGEAKKPFRLDNNSILYIYKVFKHLLMQWMAIWMHPYFIKATEVGWSCWSWVTIGYISDHYKMGEAKNPSRLDNTSILYIYQVFKHLLMQWMAIWMHPYFIEPMEVCQAD